jgi:uncharacterized membrane protein
MITMTPNLSAPAVPMLLAKADAISTHVPLVQDPAGVLAILLCVLALIFQATQHRVIGKLFKVVPALVFCYFVPTTLTTFGIIPAESALYDWVKSFVLPASLVLLILALDVPGIIRLGPKAIIMLLAGTTGVVIGAPIALLLTNLLLGNTSWALPEDVWQGMTALAGSWIGGGANFVALGEIAGASDEMIATMVIPDVFVANIWMGCLLFAAGISDRIDRLTGANTAAIDELKARLIEFQERVNRIPSLTDFMIILAIGFGLSWACGVAAKSLPEIGSAISTTTWKYILITSIGVALSFTSARNLEGAGASKIGSVLIYLLVACIGAHASFEKILEAPGLIIMGLIWMSVHVTVLLTVAKLIRAPLFYVAVGSQANIGGAASAPVVASAFHPSLAAVGALLAVAGYVLGTYAGLLCMYMLKLVAGAA